LSRATLSRSVYLIWVVARMSSELVCVFWVVALSHTIIRMRSADLIREARLRAGLTQDELARRSGTPRSVIARWEQGAVQPGFDNMLAVIDACGFELPLQLVQRDTVLDERVDQEW